MCSFCYGRPPAIDIRDADVHPPSQQDFPRESPENDIFIQRTRLCIILGHLGDARRGPRAAQEAVEAIGDSLKQWIQSLPDTLLLRDGRETKPYKRPVSELHIVYFACTILYLQTTAKWDLGLERLHGATNRATLEQCVEAAARIARLLEEVHYRNEVPFLTPIVNWFCLLAGVVIVRARPTLIDRSALLTEELGIIKTVLREMTPTVPSSNLILDNLERIESAPRSVPEGMAPNNTKLMAHGDPKLDGSHPGFNGSEELNLTACADTDQEFDSRQDGCLEWNSTTEALDIRDIEWPLDFDISDIQFDAYV